jgi:DNA primase
MDDIMVLKKRMKHNKSHSMYLIDLVKKTIDLKSFVERNGATVLKPEGNDRWKGICPLHKDGDPSFFVSKGNDGVWIYHCFGCSSGGTILDFCMELKGITNVYEAAIFAAQSEGLNCDSSLILKAAREAKIQTNKQNEVNLAHFVACENCRRLLRVCNNDKRILSWIAQSFQSMNELLDKQSVQADDFRMFREIASNKINMIHQQKE